MKGEPTLLLNQSFFQDNKKCNVVQEEINLDIRKILYNYKGSMNMDYIMNLTYDKLYLEKKYLNKILQDKGD